MPQSSEFDGIQVTASALRRLVDWNGLFRSEVKTRACQIAAETAGDSLVTTEILEEAIVATCNDIIKRIRSLPGDELKDDIRAA